MKKTYRVVFIGSAGGGVLSRLVRHAFVRDLALEAISDRDCGFLQVAAEAGISSVRLAAETGLAFSEALSNRFRGRDDVVFLSFYSKLFKGKFLQEHQGRIFNCHPALLPAFKGLRGFEDTLASGRTFMGSTLHLIDAGIDSGAPVIQAAIPIDRANPIDENRHKVFLSQYYGAAQFLRWVDDGRIVLSPEGQFRLLGAKYLPSIFSPNLDPDFFEFISEENQLGGGHSRLTPVLENNCGPVMMRDIPAGDRKDYVQSSILVFPIDIPQSMSFAQIARQLGFSVVVASSEPTDPSRYPEYVFCHLPYVTSSGFDHDFAVLLSVQRIEMVFAPHPAVWKHLEVLSRNANFPVRFKVCNGSPFAMDWQPYGEAYRWAKASAHAVPFFPETASAALPEANYAGLYRSFNQIPGQSDNAKLFALTQIARQAVRGDVVEIGTLYGKSAFALAWLAKFHDIGSLICIDPWELAPSHDQGDQASLINAAVESLDWQQAFLGFAASLAMFDNVNYLREPSEQAVAAYCHAANAGNLHSDEFGYTPVKGGISILHIDGNHKFEAVSQDLEKWLPFVMDRGWILFDDYVWAFGDGPKRVGDKYLFEHKPRTAFVAADTLFVQV
jgi:folate-dependent phosphoribosylglycinamide formyltransferase PurN